MVPLAGSTASPGEVQAMSKIARWASRLTLAAAGTTLALAAMAAADSDPAWADDTRPVTTLVERVGDVVERIVPTPPADRNDQDQGDDRGDGRPEPDCPEPTPAPDREPRPTPPARDERPAPTEPADQPTPTPEPSRPAEEPTHRPTPQPSSPPVLDPSPIDVPPIVVDIPPIDVPPVTLPPIVEIPVEVPPIVVVPPIVIDVPPVVVDLPPIVVTPTTPPVEEPPVGETPAPRPIPIPLPSQGVATPTGPTVEHPAPSSGTGPDDIDRDDTDRAAERDDRGPCASRQRATSPPRTARPAPPRGHTAHQRPDGCPGEGPGDWVDDSSPGGLTQPRVDAELLVNIARPAAVAGPPAGHLAVAGAPAHLPAGRSTHLDPRPA